MAAIVPPLLLNLTAMPGHANESHIQPGNHLRVAHNPLLGLPVAPFIVQRAYLDGRLPDDIRLYRDIVFYDNRNKVLSLPIKINAGDEVRAAIVQRQARTCIWVAMFTEAGEAIDAEQVAAPAQGAPSLHDQLSDLLGLQAEAMVDNSNLQMRAYGPSIGHGPALVGERDGAPYALGAPTIAEVVISGNGIIRDMVWIASQDVGESEYANWQTIDLLNLPHSQGDRYLSLTEPHDRSEKRVRAQAPKKRPLQEIEDVSPPDAAPEFTSDEEFKRVSNLAMGLNVSLTKLLSSGTLPLLATENFQLNNIEGQSLAADGGLSSASISHLGLVLQATLDPGVSAWLGYKALDTNFTEQQPWLCLYRIIGFFRHPQAIGATAEEIASLSLDLIPADDCNINQIILRDHVSNLGGNWLSQNGLQLEGNLQQANDYMMMTAASVVSYRAVPELPKAPTILGANHVSWLPAVPPAAVREVECSVRDVLIGSTLAAKREQPDGSFTSLNRAVDQTPWHMLIALGIPDTDDGNLLADDDGRQGQINDRGVGPAAARYHVAQQDSFGRWSDFDSQDAAAGPRPKPPRPVVQGSYQQPRLANADTIRGELILLVPLPEDDSLAPGSFQLSHVRLSFRHYSVGESDTGIQLPDLEVAVATAIPIENPPHGEAPRRAVPANQFGPTLAPAEQRRMVITAVWVDKTGQQSATSEPLRLLMTDPRSPSQLEISDKLLYSSRPDATGLAWVERSWTVPNPNPLAYAAYYTDEVRLISWLRDERRTVEANEIASDPDRATRANRFRAIQDDFPDHLFERLPRGAIDAPSATTRRLRHALSGSSRVLNAYKIATEAPANGARPDLGSIDIVFYGVPNSDPPPRPFVTVRLVDPLPGEPPLIVEVNVTLKSGFIRGELVRIYRTRGGPSDPQYAPIIAVKRLKDDPLTKNQTFQFRDRGTAFVADKAQLSAFTSYQWFAEVQGSPESGSTVPGLWSLPSDPVGLDIVPLSRPAAPTVAHQGTITEGGIQNLTMTISHPLGLSPTPLGPWRYKILRSQQDGIWAKMATGIVRETRLQLKDDAADGDLTPLGTIFQVILIDPIGRETPALSVLVTNFGLV